MAGEFKHIDHNGDLVQDITEYESVDEHTFDGGTTGDLAYYDGNHLVRKAQGFLNKIYYVVAAADSDATAKLTADLVCTGTSDNPIDATTINTALAANTNVLLLAGNYYINAALTPQTKSTLKGQGMYRTIINNKGSTYGIDFEGTSSAAADRKENLVLEDFSVVGAVGSSLAGLYSRFVYGPNRALGVRFRGGEYGVQLGNNGAQWTFQSCRFDVNHIGVELGVSSNPTMFIDCVWSTNGRLDEWATAGEGLLINGNTNEITILGGNFNSSGKQAIGITSAMHTLKVTGTHFEDNATDTSDDTTRTAVLINNASAIGVSFDNCWFNGEDSNGDAFSNHAITLAAGSNVVATMCGFRKLVTSCYDIASGKTLYEWLTYLETSPDPPATSSGAGTLASIQTA